MELAPDHIIVKVKECEMLEDKLLTNNDSYFAEETHARVINPILSLKSLSQTGNDLPQT